jgi:hypothetical protein
VNWFSLGRQKWRAPDLVRQRHTVEADGMGPCFSVASCARHITTPRHMLHYYTTPETRAALIAESNRIIASRAAAKAAKNPTCSSRNESGGYSRFGLRGSMPYTAQEPTIAPKYQGLMSFIAAHPLR